VFVNAPVAVYSCCRRRRMKEQNPVSNYMNE
jgi:hypothetical protein